MYQQLTEKEKSEIASVFSEFDVGDIINSTKNTKANVNIIYLVETKQGRFILRKSNPKTTAQQLLFEAEMLGFLEKKNYPFSPKIIETKTKEKQVLKEGIYYRLFSFLEGKNHLDWNSRDFYPQEYIAQFQFMKQFHEELQDFQPAVPTDYPDVLTFLQTFPQELDHYKKVAEQKNCFFSKLLLQHVSLLKKSAEECLLLLEQISYNTIPKQVIHGDVHFGNLLFTEFSISGVVDFDWSGIETPYWDFAYCFSQNGTHWNATDDGKLDFPLFFIALQSYFGKKEISDKELQLLQFLVKVGDLRAVKWEINSYYDLDFEEKYVGFLQHTMRTLQMNEYHLLGVDRK